MEEKSILFILNNLEGGGAERIFVNIANEFVSRNIKVQFLLGKKTGVYFNLLHPGIIVSILNETSVLGLVKKLPAYLNKNTFTHIFTASDYISAATIITKRRYNGNYTIVATLHYNLPYQLSILPFKNKTWLIWLNKNIISQADKIVAVSDGVNEGFRQIVNKPLYQLSTIYNPVYDHSIFELGSEEIEAKFRQRSFLINVGRLTVQKNQMNLLQAYKIVTEHHPDLELLILGIGDRESELKAFVNSNGLADKVHFLGFQTNPFKYLSKASLFVLSSDYEGLPTVLIESLALGVNVVSTDCPSGPREILCNEDFGFLAKMKNPQHLAEKIEEALFHPKSISLLKKRAEVFIKERAVKEYLQLIQ